MHVFDLPTGLVQRALGCGHHYRDPRFIPLAIIDAEQGRTRAQQVLDRLRSLDAPAVVQEAYIKGGNDAVMVALNEPSSMPFMLMPGEGIQFRCAEESAAIRLAEILGYDCVEIG